MKTKSDIKKMLSAIKNGAKKEESREMKPLTIISPTHRERDMRQDAIDMGCHGAQDIWGDPNAGPI